MSGPHTAEKPSQHREGDKAGVVDDHPFELSVPSRQSNDWMHSASVVGGAQRNPSYAALTEVRAGNIILRQGSSGATVAALQELLNSAGTTPPLKPDGVFGSATKEALQKFQREHNLQADGVAGKSTISALEANTSPASFAQGQNEFAQSFQNFAPSRTHLGDWRGLHNTFDTALKHTLRFEGGISRDQNDRGNRGGNATNMGITQETLNSWTKAHGLPPQRTADISKATASQIYYELYWKAGKCDQLPETLAIIHFDTCVNMGSGTGARILQRALNVPVDGKIGPDTLGAAAKADQKELLREYCGRREQLYRNLAAEDGQQKFLAGWLNRLNALRQHYDIPDGAGNKVTSPITLSAATRG